MSRLAGPRVALVPVPHPLAVAVVAGDAPGIERELAALGLRAGPGWPHADTSDALGGLVEHSSPVGTWLVAVSGAVVGDCGWQGEPDADGVVEIGYGLAAGARGQGLGTEAVGVLAAWVERQPGVRLVTAEVLVGNEPSLRLLARLGFSERGSHPPYVRMVRPAPGVPAPPVRGRHVC